MKSLDDCIVRMRRMLRDPGGTVWTDDDLQTYWNDAQIELAQKVGVLEKAESHYYPPRYDWVYMWDFEFEFTEGDKYQALVMNQASGDVMCFPWEAGYWLDTLSAIDDGHRWTNPWESYYSTSADVIPMELTARFYKMKFAAYDQDPISPLSEREVAALDRYHRTRIGEVTNYYRPDQYSNKLILYPAPGTIVWHEPTNDEFFYDTGGRSDSEAVLFYDDYGVSSDEISSADALFIVYEYIPNDVEVITETLDGWPDWMTKYVEYGTLERAFAAETDGFIPSLRDYWRMRKEIGINSIKKYKRMRRADRDYRLGPTSHRGQTSKGAALPEGYPAT